MNIDQIHQALSGIAQAMNSTAQAIKTVFPQQTGTAATATAGAATLPADPVGFIIVTLPNGDIAKIPYYAE